MATLTVWKFDSPTGAGDAARTLQDLSDDDLIIRDAATVVWELDEKKPRTHQLTSTAGTGALGGAFWGLLFGMVFYVPLLGAAIGAATGALAGSLTYVGIDDVFINKVRDQVTPGTSALFVLTSEEVMDRFRKALAGHQPADLIVTNLSGAQEAALRSVFPAE